jgi:hypothetical protein
MKILKKKKDNSKIIEVPKRKIQGGEQTVTIFRLGIDNQLP